MSMIDKAALALARWINEHQGQKPARVRVSQAVYDQMVDDMRDLLIEPGSEQKRPQSATLLGVPLCVDKSLSPWSIED